MNLITDVISPAREPAPTLRAIEQHVTKLRKSNGATSASPSKTVAPATNPKTPKTPKTARARAIPKTPTSSAKRKAPSTSEDDRSDSEEPDMKSIKVEQTRSSLPRRSKSAQPTYDEASPNDSGEDDDGGEKEQDGVDHSIPKFDPSRYQDFDDEGGDSDVSNFEKTFS